MRRRAEDHLPSRGVARAYESLKWKLYVDVQFPEVDVRSDAKLQRSASWLRRSPQKNLEQRGKRAKWIAVSLVNPQAILALYMKACCNVS